MQVLIRDSRVEFTGKSAVLVTAAVATAATVFICIAPFVDFAYREKSLHVAIEATATIVALFAALLTFGRFTRSLSVSDLALAGALSLLALTNLFFSSAPSLSAHQAGRFAVWSPTAGRLVGAAALAAAPWMPQAKVRRPRRAVLHLLAAVGGLLILISLLTAFFAPRLPADIAPRLFPSDPTEPRLVGPAWIVVLQIAGMALFGAAALGFARRAERTGDELMSWLAAASVLGLFARLNYLLFPSLYPDWVYPGDFLRLGFYLLLLVGAGREIAAYQKRLAEAAVFEERRRLARDLHDGLAQELAYISSQLHRLRVKSADRQAVDDIGDAANRALEESRDAIAALVRPTDEPLDVALEEAAELLATRAGVQVRVELEPDVEVPLTTREALIRIVREAVTNATRHGSAENIVVRLVASPSLVLTVRDDGRGFPPGGQGNGRGHGLASMRERTRGLGGELRVTSSSGGTTVEVRLP